MTDRWDGRGLPPVAGARIGRAARDGVRTSLLSADDVAGLEPAGVTPAVILSDRRVPRWRRRGMTEQ
ncbi:hypothetical protein [Actinoplanes sp. NPDC051411]|uniref:hypothetical protein n=1 Tax=Actinoplanes sp. NPDC051411 TaxID=3155522 RepID=UPI003426EE31